VDGRAAVVGAPKFARGGKEHRGASPPRVAWFPRAADEGLRLPGAPSMSAKARGFICYGSPGTR
jgi:hypothetical protein